MATFNEINLKHTGYTGIMSMRVDLDAYYDDAWHDIYEGIYGSTTQFTLAEAKEIEKIRVRYYWLDTSLGQTFDYELLYEVYLTLNDTGKTLPTSHDDLGSSWTNEELAYDDNIATAAHVIIPSDTWSSILEFNFVAVTVVVTDAISDKGIDHAHGNGTLTSNTNATERGFEVKLTFSGTLYEYIERHIAGFSTGSVSYNSATGKWEGTITKVVSEEGDFVEGAFEGDLGRFPIAVFSDRLFAAETYEYRAYAVVDGVTYHGEYVEFTMNSYPAGQLPDDQIPITDIIPTEVPIIAPESPLDILQGDAMEGIALGEEFPGLELPEFEFPEFEYPDFPPYNGSWLGWFYYRKAYTKKDLDELRRKCRIFQDNSVEYALVINHNSRVLQQFLNTMTDYMGADEHNTFRPIIPTQHLNALARSPLDIHEFKSIINSFISNSIDNANNVNNNFQLIRDGLSDYAYTEDEGFTDISITTRLVVDNNPDVDSLKKVIDRLNREMANNYKTINHNLHVLRSVLI